VRLTILAVGRLKAGPERLLYDRYAERIAGAGKGVGISLALREFGEGRAGSAAARITDETASINAAAGDGKPLVVLDAGGKSLTSTAFAERVARWRDDGAREVAFVIGGPDGLDRALVARADLVLAFGAMTWPHQLVRIMLAEQLYRTVTILAGHPYHRAGAK
jgi:23S rRNA (pseudouridine1915-N3)-methyltransferase